MDCYINRIIRNCHLFLILHFYYHYLISCFLISIVSFPHSLQRNAKSSLFSLTLRNQSMSLILADNFSSHFFENISYEIYYLAFSNTTCFFVHPPLFVPFVWEEVSLKEVRDKDHLITWSSAFSRVIIISSLLPPSLSYKLAQMSPISLKSSSAFASFFSHCLPFLFPRWASGNSWLHPCLAFP